MLNERIRMELIHALMYLEGDAPYPEHSVVPHCGVLLPHRAHVQTPELKTIGRGWCRGVRGRGVRGGDVTGVWGRGVRGRGVRGVKDIRM